MKKILSLVTACACFLSSFAQTIQVATDKTVSLVFPFAVTYVDRGNPGVLVQQVREANNVLLVKAASVDLTNTNLSVTTSDGSIYAFAVQYNSNPPLWIYEVPDQKSSRIDQQAISLLDNPRIMRGGRDFAWGMSIDLSGVYVKENVLYYQLRISNQSPVDYDVDLLRFYIRDKRKGKRTAVQENELTPIYVAGNTRQVKAFMTTVIVVALEKFTIPDAKYFGIEMMERNGGRHLFVKTGNKRIVQAALIPSSN